jgi:hypothetical protein
LRTTALTRVHARVGAFDYRALESRDGDAWEV